MKIIITRNYQEMSARAADFVLAQVWEKPNSVLGLATGSTPLGLYQELIKAYQEGRVSFSKITTFNLDEYIGLGFEDKQSYHYFMRSNFFDHVNIKEQNIFIPDGLTERIKLPSYCWRYEKQINRHGGIDLQILGIGRNGHIGFNEPGTSFTSGTHVTRLAKKTIEDNSRFFSDKSKVPKQAITMGLGTITRAKKIVLLASGEEKADAVAKAVEGQKSTEVPASVLQIYPDVTFIIDEAAASKLQRNYQSPLALSNKGLRLLTKSDLPRDKKIVVISPHPDDASISLGGIISSLSEDNKVYTFIMTTGYRAFISNKDRDQRIKIREDEVREESRILGAEPVFLHLNFYDAKNLRRAILSDIKTVRQKLKNIEPDIIFLPHKKDSHPTHVTSREIILKSLPKFNFFKENNHELWYYEGPWAIFAESDFNTIFAFPEDTMNKKMRAIRSQTSQISRTRFDIAAQSLAKLRAALIPEQALVGFGRKAPKTDEYYELFKVIKY